MPKAASYRLTWSATDRLYQVQETQDHILLAIEPHSPAWFAWLDQIPSFAFWGQRGHYTARKERRPRGAFYWYAYVGNGQKLTKKYVGKTSDITLTRLEAVAAKLAAADAPPGELPDQLNVSLASVSADAAGGSFPQDDASKPFRWLAEMHSQHDPLLATKLHPPHLHRQLVSRPQLTSQIQQGVKGTLTLISAPAGFGKTTLLTQWLAESGMPVAWLSLEPEDNEPSRFFSSVFAALHTLHPQLGTAAHALLEASPHLPVERVLTLLLNDLLERPPDPFALVLDDYHLIGADAIHRGIGFLLEHLRGQMHLVLATRVAPPLPLARLRAHGQLTEVRAADLRFAPNEVQSFLHTVMGLDLPAGALIALERRTEGWIAGLQLAALSLQGRTNVPAFLTAFTGSHRFVFDYLIEEAFSRQPTAIQSFLLSTSILERLSGPLCEAVTGQQDSQARLVALEQANLFVVALDDERHWYRYHHLFAEALRARLQQTDPALVSQLHLRASRWYEQQGWFAEAVQHALAASAVERTADLIEHIDVNSWAGLGTAVQRVLGWLAHLPEPVVRARPLLCIVHAIALMFTHQLPEAEARLQQAERCLDGQVLSEQVQFLRGHIAATRGVIARFSGDLARSMALSQQALTLLPHPELTPGPICRLNVAHAFLVTGEVTAAQERTAWEMVTSLRASGNQSMTMRSLTNLAQLQLLQGRLHQAAATFQKAAQVARGQEDLPAITGSPVASFGLAEVLREWNELDQAESSLAQGMELIEGDLTAEGEVVTLGYTTLARLFIARGEYAQARRTVDTFLHLAGTRAFAPHLIARGIAWRSHLDLLQGQFSTASGWAEQSGLKAAEDDLSYLQEREYLTLARIRLAQGREAPSASFLQEVVPLLERRLQDAEAKARGSSVLELLLLQALALVAQGKRKAAFAALSRALSLAEPEGYIRLFVDEGEPMRDLLRQAYTHGISPQYVGTLLAVFGEPEEGTAARAPSPPGVLLEPLTRREREVLQLLAEGASNREIAQRLVLSTGTVKKYVSTICGKLGVQSRTQALVRSRALHLL